jgi:phosphonate transport system substrate-binding protein
MYMIFKRSFNILIMNAFLMQVLVVAGYADAERRHITIAVLPCYNMVTAFKKFHPLAKHLEQQTGFEIKLVVSKDAAEFERGIKHGDIDFAFQDPHTYVKLAGLFNKDALICALTWEGATSQYGVIIARKLSGINKLTDLKGKTVMFGPKLSAIKWTAAKCVFEKNGININKDLKAYFHGGCCEDIAFNVYLKAVDAGVVCGHFFEKHLEKQRKLGIDAEKIIVIGRTASVPTRIFAPRQDISDDTVAKIYHVLLTLDKKQPEHAKILHRIEMGGFQRAKDKDYDGIRMLIGATWTE